MNDIRNYLVALSCDRIGCGAVSWPAQARQFAVLVHPQIEYRMGERAKLLMRSCRVAVALREVRREIIAERFAFGAPLNPVV
jgi:hypothetical protein